MSAVLEPTPTMETVGIEVLIEQANSHHHAVVDAESTAKVHAIRCGEALIAIREILKHDPPEGGWRGWCERNFHATQEAGSKYIKLAYYKDQLPEGLNLTASYEWIKGKPRVADFPKADHYGQDVRQRAIALRGEGHSVSEIARRLNGPTMQTVSTWFDPEGQRERQRRADERVRAKRQREQDLAKLERQLEIKALRARLKDKPVSRADSHVDAALALLQGVWDDRSESKEIRDLVQDAMSGLYRAHDAMVTAMLRYKS